MKSKFKFLVVLFTFVVFIANAGVEKKKEFSESWAASGVESLNVVNKFGEIKITNNEGSEVTVDVVVTVEASNESKAEKLLNRIDVTIRKSGSMVKAITSIDDDFKSQMKFSIDYTINIPSDKNLIIENKFGNTILNELNAKGSFDIKYGNLTAAKLNGNNRGDIKILLGYGNANIETISDATIEIKYSKLNAEDAGNLKVFSKYSVLTIEELKTINAESKYDTYNLEEVGSLTATSKYSHFKIVELKKALKIESGYGGIKVSEVSADFESIWIENSYGSINLGLSDNASYDIDASCEYCGISYDEGNFKGNKESKNHTKKINGKIGESASGAKVYVNSRYGGIKLN